MCRLFFCNFIPCLGFVGEKVLDKDTAVIYKVSLYKEGEYFVLHFTGECEIQSSDGLESSGDYLFLP